MTIDKKELHELFQGTKKESRTAFEVLYKRYNRLVYKIAFSILKNKENSEDVMQNVFTKVYQLPPYKLPENKEASWLYTVTKNEAIEKLRRTKQYSDMDTIYNVEANCKEIEDIIDNDKYNRIINSLNEKEKEIVSLKILGQLSFKEIANLKNIPIGTVQWHYYKALDSIKILLGNISMFILTAILYVKNRVIRNKANKGEITQEIEQNTEEFREDSVQEESQDFANKVNRVEDELKNEENTINNNIETNEAIEVETQHVQNNIKSKILLGASSLFLLFTIIFLIICIKHQQNARRKASK